MNEDFLRWVAEKKLAGSRLSVCVCVSKHFREQRPIGWSDRDRGGTDGRAETPERQWCRSRVGRRHVARGTCCRVKACKKIARTYRSNGRHRRSQTSRSYVYHPNLSAFGVVVPEGRRLHAPGEENFFDMGSSGSRKL